MDKQAQTILVVDDTPQNVTLLEDLLSSKGYRIITANCGREGLRAVRESSPDLVLLDIMMPDITGYEVCRQIRGMEGHELTPIVMTTALDGKEERVKGIEAGADDYLVKPFEPKELLLRINAILRRMPEAPETNAMPKLLSLGPLRYDIERGELWQGEDAVRLTATESQLMRIFAARPGEAVSRAQLVEDLGRDKGQSQERAVDVQITRLRRKLEADPKQPRYLQTVRGAGYMLAPD